MITNVASGEVAFICKNIGVNAINKYNVTCFPWIASRNSRHITCGIGSPARTIRISDWQAYRELTLSDSCGSIC